MSNLSPYEQIKFINDAIKDRQEKNEPTFFSVKVERNGELTPMVNKEQGANFYETILQYLTKYDLSALIIELYHGKSHNIKEPFQNFKLILKKSPNITLGNNQIKDGLTITPAEAFISPEKHFVSLVEKERQVMLLEFDNKRLQYEFDELKRKYKKKKNYVEQLESELGSQEKNKKNSLGNVSFGMIGANAIESFAKSDFGIGILKNIFGAKQDVLNGLLGITEGEKKEDTISETKSTATIITKSSDEKIPVTEEEKIRAGLKTFIHDFFNKSNDTVLRMYYELIQNLGTDTETLQSVIQQVKSYREKQKAFIEKKIKENSTNNVNDDSQEGKDETKINDSS